MPYNRCARCRGRFPGRGGRVRLKAPALKAGIPGRGSGVRIPPPPPLRAPRPLAAAAGNVAGCLLYYIGSPLGEVAESAEGSRLLSGYRAKSSVQGSNPCLSAMRP